MSSEAFGENTEVFSLGADQPDARVPIGENSAHTFNMNEVIAKRLGLFGELT
jgi:hypothetical protein